MTLYYISKRLQPLSKKTRKYNWKARFVACFSNRIYGPMVRMLKYQKCMSLSQPSTTSPDHLQFWDALQSAPAHQDQPWSVMSTALPGVTSTVTFDRLPFIQHLTYIRGLWLQRTVRWDTVRFYSKGIPLQVNIQSFHVPAKVKDPIQKPAYCLAFLM